MKPAYFIVLLFVITISALCAQNQMALMNTIYGEFDGDKFGSHMVAMDYNGDGYDDLIVLSDMWNETGIYDNNNFKGKIYFYWGGPVFDNVPDFVLEGQQHNDYTSYHGNIPGICNSGDMNGDGIDDLAIARSYDCLGGAYKSLDLYLGGGVPQPIPDYIITYQQTALFPRWLGDINNDGKADLAVNGYHYSRYPPFCYLWTDLNTDPILFRSTPYNGRFYLHGVGDVNNDGYSDSFMTTPLTPSSYFTRAVLYYGDSTAALTDSLMIAEYLDQGGVYIANPLGDINGDSFDDFIGLFDFDYHYIWLGSTELDSIPDLQLSRNTNDHDMTLFARGAQVYAVYGDMNGDGYSDFVCSDSGANGWNGQAGLWMGGPNVNSTVDLVLDPPIDWQFRNFGHAKAVGDFNGDGFDDLALSCPWWSDGGASFIGRVYVYAGNAQLEDTSVSTDDPVNPPEPDYDGSFEVYPNPGKSENNWITVSFSGDLFSRPGRFSYSLYNIRGQLLDHGILSSAELKNSQFDLRISDLGAGIYQIVLLYEGRAINNRKIIVY